MHCSSPLRFNLFFFYSYGSYWRQNSYKTIPNTLQPNAMCNKIIWFRNIASMCVVRTCFFSPSSLFWHVIRFTLKHPQNPTDRIPGCRLNWHGIVKKERAKKTFGYWTAKAFLFRSSLFFFILLFLDVLCQNRLLFLRKKNDLKQEKKTKEQLDELAKTRDWQHVLYDFNENNNKEMTRCIYSWCQRKRRKKTTQPNHAIFSFVHKFNKYFYRHIVSCHWPTNEVRRTLLDSCDEKTHFLSIVRCTRKFSR